MLEGLDAIDWRGLLAYGDSTRIPELIRTLTCEDREDRQQALYELFQTIWHQGDVYPATYHVIPFLIELLRSPSFPGKVQVLDELSSLVHCYSGSVKATLKALASGMPTYRELLADADWQTRLAAAGALSACCRGRRAIVARDLLGALAVEPDDRVQLELLLLLGGVAGDEQAGILLAIVDAEPDAPTAAGPRATRPICWAAAISLTLVAREHAPKEAIRLLATTFDDPGPIDEALRHCRGTDPRPCGMPARCWPRRASRSPPRSSSMRCRPRKGAMSYRSCGTCSRSRSPASSPTRSSGRTRGGLPIA